MTDGAPSAAPKSQLPEFPAALLQFDLPHIAQDRNNLEISLWRRLPRYKMGQEWWIYGLWVYGRQILGHFADKCFLSHPHFYTQILGQAFLQ